MDARPPHVPVNDKHADSCLSQSHARLIAVVVFPSAGTQEVTTKILGARPAEESKTEVRK